MAQSHRPRLDFVEYLNPRVLVEVLSPTTEEYDRGDKLWHYKKMASLAAVVLIAHDTHRVDVLVREGDEWREITVTGTDTAELACIGCKLPLPDIYRNPLAQS